MPNSLPHLSPKRLEHSTHSSVVVFATGTNGQTSTAPIRGCAPLWWRMSISSCANTDVMFNFLF